jgi:hypothetical protein
MAFSADMGRFIEKVRQRGNALYLNCVSHVETSIKAGSPVTGAPGQPVQTGALLNSWQTTFNGPVAEVSTNLEYAEPIEINERGATLRSEVGGFHSVALTRAGWPSIVEAEARALGAPE